MQKRNAIPTAAALVAFGFVTSWPWAGLPAPPTRPAAAQATQAQATRGEYLVRTMACNDCHTPWKMGDHGPEPDMSRMLSGHPQDMAHAAGARRGRGRGCGPAPPPTPPTPGRGA